MRCFCSRKEGHVKINCEVWKKVMEKEENNCKPKMEINVDMVEWD